MSVFDRFRRRRSDGYDRPDWMTDGMPVTMYEGDVDLEVVDESYYSDELWMLSQVPYGQRVRKEVSALLAEEPDNPYDSNAIAVWIGGFKVGHLSRDDARRLRPGLLALERSEGKKIALGGVIVGGGNLDGGATANLGVFLKYDPEDFGLPPVRSAQRQPRGSGLRTGLSETIRADENDDSYDLSWMDGLSSNEVSAITQLRRLLVDESDPIDLHFIYAELERRLYKSRDAFSSALDEYDAACEEHDDLMDEIRLALVERLGAVPLLETYKQQAIRQQKAKRFAEALHWADRGIDLYGDEADDPSWPDDLRERRGKYAAKLGDS